MPPSFRRYALPLLLLLASGASVASAQSFGGVGTTAPFSISIAPQYPNPFASVTLTPVSGQVDVVGATLRVSVRGKTLYDGDAEPVAVPLGAAGIPVDIVVVLSSGGATYPQQLTVTPQDVTLVAEPIASANALYPGKPGIPEDGSVRMVAVADLKTAKGSALNPSALVYDWNVDGVRIANGSGIGRDALIVASPLMYRQRTVSVTVTSLDSTASGGASLTFSSTPGTLRLYENDPLLGIRFDHALSGTYTLPGTESTLFADPFSFPTDNGAPTLEWFLNGASAQTGSSITLRPTGSGQGSAALSLTASSAGVVGATASLSVSFGARASSGLFGL